MAGVFQLKRASVVSAIGAVLLAGCSLIPKETVPNAGPPPRTAETQTNPEQHFDHAMELLQQGKAEEADAELHSYLDAVPNSKSARFLIQQIETPVVTLFPLQYFRVRIPRGGSLSWFAKTYLGNSLAFYGLARYNGIAVPTDVHEGQWLRIPKTPPALAARRAAAVSQSPPRSSVEPEPPLLVGCLPGRSCSQLVTPEEKLARPSSDEENKSATPDAQPPSRVVAERHYHAGLLAFQKQDLNEAIAAWQKALAADPGFIEARVRLLEAEHLKQKLQKLRN